MQHDEQAIKTLNDIFVSGLLSKDPKKRASIWLDDGTLLPPNAGFLEGRAEIEKHFALEGAEITSHSKADLSNYRFDFLTPELAFVDADLTLRDLLSPDQKRVPEVLVKVVFVAERRSGKWWIRNERAHFSASS
ncbi:MAG TPA: SgcJ/EcaC family oxidoreductase [Stellaceae bacterium]|nr:SgcJ/EcaC family oxidoreductase [Stellaceae bacterium]